MEQMYKHSDLFLTHTWRTDLHGRNNHARVRIVNEHLNRLGYLTWFDEKSMSGDIKAKMAEGVDFTKCVLVFVTEEYMKKIDADDDDNCKFEYDRALAQKTVKNILCIVMEEEYHDPSKWFGKLQHTLGNCLFVSMTGDLSDKKYLYQQLQLVVDQLKSKGVVPSQTKNMCEDCTITSKNGKQQPLFGDGNACTYCDENLKSTSEPKNYCVTCHIHSNGSYCHSCKMHLLDKNQRIEELKEELLELISLESNVDLSNYNLKSFQDVIDKMKNDLQDLETKRGEAQTNDLRLHINKNDYDKKVIELHNDIDYLMNSTSTLDETKHTCIQSLQPSYQNELLRFEDYMRSLDKRREEYFRHTDEFSRTIEKLDQVKKQVSEFANTAAKGEKHVHDKSCSCEECVIEREITWQLISNGREYLKSLIVTNDIERLKTALDLKSEIKKLQNDKKLNLLLSLTVQHGTVEMLKMLLKAGVYIDCEKLGDLVNIGWHKNLFRKMMSDNNVKGLQSLVESQKEITEAKDRNGFNLLLSLTMQNGTVDMLFMLLEMGAPVDTNEMGKLLKTSGTSLLRKVISENNSEGLRKIIELQNDIINTKDENGFNLLLLFTVQCGKLEMFNMLVAIGCEEDIVNTRNETLLHYVKNSDIAKMLCVKHGDAVLSVKDEYGRTPFMKAYIENYTNILETISTFVQVEEEIKEKNNCLTLLFEKKGFDYIQELINNNNITTMATLLTLKPDIISMIGGFSQDTTPFLYCCSWGSIDMLKVLVDHGSDVNKCNTYGYSALACVVLFNKTEWCEGMVEYLCTIQPQLLTMEEINGNSVFHSALTFNRAELISILLKHSPPPQLLEKKKNTWSKNLIELAKDKGFDPIVQMFENYIKDNKANTAKDTK